MTEQQQIFYQSIYGNEALFELWAKKLNPNEVLWVGAFDIETGLKTDIKSVKVKDADTHELKIFWAQFCANAALENANIDNQ